MWTATALNPGTVDASELTFLQTTETDATTGAWSFTGLGPFAACAKYYVADVGETGWTQTFGTAGDVITPTFPTRRSSDLFANFKSFDISGTKYTDVNGLDANSNLT